MRHGDDPVVTNLSGDVFRVCQTLALVSFSLWLVNSYAISNSLASAKRLFGKFLGR